MAVVRLVHQVHQLQAVQEEVEMVVMVLYLRQQVEGLQEQRILEEVEVGLHKHLVQEVLVEKELLY